MRKLRIIYFHSDRISLISIPFAFHLLGHDVIDTEFRPHLRGLLEEDIYAVEKEINRADRADLVFTYDFIPAVSIACEHIGIKYLAWVYDCPQMELFRTETGNSCSFISVFDRSYYEYLGREGTVKNLYHFPLAADLDMFSTVSISPEDETCYAADVSFLGRLYERKYVRTIYEMCSQSEKDEIAKVTKDAICKWGSDQIKGKASDELVDNIYAYFGNSTDSFGNVDRRYFVEKVFLSPKCNELERKVMLNSLAKRFSVTLYSDKLQYDDIDPGIILRGHQDYFSEMPKVFYMSRINLNITSKSMETGIPQRVWDVLAVGGFCLTNYQPELEDYFDLGRDLVVYHDLSECEELIAYYLTHERERLQIALNGYKKAQLVGDIKYRLQEVIDTI